MHRAAKLGERYFRRGLVMGLTLAEIMLLVLFALLLLLGWRVQEGAADAQATDKLKRLQEAAGLPSTGENGFDDNFTHLLLATRAGKMAMAALQEQDVPLNERRLKDLEALVTLGKATQRVLGRNTMSETPRRSATLALERIEQLYGASMAGSAAIWLDGLLQCAKSCGPGGDLPPCVRTATGKPALVFDAVLNSNSIVLRETAIPELENVRGQWPTQSIHFGRELSADEFLAQTAQIFEWSQQRMCRFFVNVVDDTGPSEKLIYKTRLRTVEAHFYKHESIGLARE